MLLYVLLLIVISPSTIYSQEISDSSCETHINKLDPCEAVISFSGDCYSTNVTLHDTEYANCTGNSFFWSYPVYNMTLTIETPFTPQRKPYTISLDNEQLSGAITNVYRIINHHEYEITTHDKTLYLHSDANYQIVLKFQGPTHLSRYGVNINYKSP